MIVISSKGQGLLMILEEGYMVEVGGDTYYVPHRDGTLYVLKCVYLIHVTPSPRWGSSDKRTDQM